MASLPSKVSAAPLSLVPSANLLRVAINHIIHVIDEYVKSYHSKDRSPGDTNHHRPPPGHRTTDNNALTTTIQSITYPLNRPPFKSRYLQPIPHGPGKPKDCMPMPWLHLGRLHCAHICTREGRPRCSRLCPRRVTAPLPHGGQRCPSAAPCQGCSQPAEAIPCFHPERVHPEAGCIAECKSS